MSQEAVHQVIGRAVVDAQFRKFLFDNPTAALAQYDLSTEERGALSALDQGQLEAFAGQLDERITKSRWTPTG